MVRELRLTPRGDRRRREGRLRLGRGDVRDDGEDGEVVDLLAPDGSFRGRGFYSRRSVAVVSESKTTVDDDFFRRRIRRASRRRRRVLDDPRSYRVVHGTADLIPGLVVDRYGSVLVVQHRHPAIDRRKETILDVLVELFAPRSVYARNDLDLRSSLGLERSRGLMAGEELPDRVTVQEDPYRLVADLRGGQKTGFYLDQVSNRARFTRYVSDDEVGLDCFSYSGGWGMAALQGGAGHVTFVDQSREALRLVRENAELNGWDDRIECVRANVLDFLSERVAEGDDPDFLVLDPPAFARSEDQLEEARRGYGKINREAMQLLKPGGTLATSSCTAPLTPEAFRRVLDKCAHDVHALFRVDEQRFQSPDHPWLVRVPRTRYLTCFLGEVRLP